MKRRSLLLCTALSGTACREVGVAPSSAAASSSAASSSAASSPATPTAPAVAGEAASAPATDSRTLRARIVRQTGRGGHGPLPQRGVNADSLEALSRQWQRADVPACIELLTDDDAVVRLSCIHLLARHAPEAADLVEARRAALPKGTPRMHLDAALIDLRNLR